MSFFILFVTRNVIEVGDWEDSNRTGWYATLVPEPNGLYADGANHVSLQSIYPKLIRPPQWKMSSITPVQTSNGLQQRLITDLYQYTDSMQYKALKYT